MYSDIKQGEHELTEQLDHHIKDLVKRCQYQTEAEKWYIGESCFFMQQIILKSKSGSDQKRREGIMYKALLQHAKEHKMTMKYFNWHKSNGGIATATTID